MFVILQESNSLFGPNVVKEVVKNSEKYKNLIITCSNSGKMENKHVKLWFDNCIKKLVKTDKCLLLLDSFSGHKKKRNEMNLQKECDEIEIDQTDSEFSDMVDTEILPASTTSLIQPLDRFFIQFKIVYRKLVIQQLQLSIRHPQEYSPVHLRSTQLRLISLVHQQFKSDSFKPLIRGCWSLCGYDNGEEMQEFDNANKVLFDLDKVTMCSTDSCSKVSFIKCAFCRSIICFDCFIKKDDHFHFEVHLKPTKLNYEQIGMVKKPEKNNESGLVYNLKRKSNFDQNPPKRRGMPKRQQISTETNESSTHHSSQPNCSQGKLKIKSKPRNNRKSSSNTDRNYKSSISKSALKEFDELIEQTEIELQNKPNPVAERIKKSIEDEYNLEKLFALLFLNFLFTSL